MVALTGGPEGDTLIRRAARIAARTKGADLLAVHVARSDGLAGADPAHLARQRVLVESLGGTYHQVVGDRHPGRAAGLRPRRQRHPARARGVSRRGRLAQLLSPRRRRRPPPRESGPIDVHLVTHEEVGRGRRRSASGRRPDRAPPAGRLRAGRGRAAAADPRCWPAARTSCRSPATSCSTWRWWWSWPRCRRACGRRWSRPWPAPCCSTTTSPRPTTPSRSARATSSPSPSSVVAVAVCAVVDLAARRTREAARSGRRHGR